jgi:hypothetical protein
VCLCVILRRMLCGSRHQAQRWRTKWPAPGNLWRKPPTIYIFLFHNSCRLIKMARRRKCNQKISTISRRTAAKGTKEPEKSTRSICVESVKDEHHSYSRSSSYLFMSNFLLTTIVWKSLSFFFLFLGAAVVAVVLPNIF